MVDIFSLCSKKIGFQLQLKGLDANFPKTSQLLFRCPNPPTKTALLKTLRYLILS